MAANMAGDVLIPGTWLLKRIPKKSVSTPSKQGVSLMAKESPFIDEDAVEELPIAFRKDAAARMKEWINSPDYERRLKEAAAITGKDVEDLDARGIIEKRVSNNNYFPAFMKE